MTQSELNAMVAIGQVPTSTDAFGRRATRFNKLVEERKVLKELIKQSEEEVESLDTELKNLFADCDSKTVMVGRDRVTLAENPGRPILSQQLLLERGVPAAMIRQCTVQGKPYRYILVTEPPEPSRSSTVRGVSATM